MGQHSDCPKCSEGGCQCKDLCTCNKEVCKCCPSAAGERCGPCARFGATEDCSCPDQCECGIACICCAASSKAGRAAKAQATA